MNHRGSLYDTNPKQCIIYWCIYAEQKSYQKMCIKFDHSLKCDPILMWSLPFKPNHQQTPQNHPVKKALIKGFTNHHDSVVIRFSDLDKALFLGWNVALGGAVPLDSSAYHGPLFFRCGSKTYPDVLRLLSEPLVSVGPPEYSWQNKTLDESTNKFTPNGQNGLLWDYLEGSFNLRLSKSLCLERGHCLEGQLDGEWWLENMVFMGLEAPAQCATPKPVGQLLVI